MMQTVTFFYIFFAYVFTVVINIGETWLSTQENGIISVIDDTISDRKDRAVVCPIFTTALLVLCKWMLSPFRTS